MKSIAPNIHHRFGGDTAISGQRHDRETLRRWFERLARVLPNLQLKINDIWVEGWPWRTTKAKHWKTRTVPCGHDVMLDLPEELTTILIEATQVGATSRPATRSRLPD